MDRRTPYSLPYVPDQLHLLEESGFFRTALDNTRGWGTIAQRNNPTLKQSSKRGMIILRR
jgi:hypothetical protein